MKAYLDGMLSPEEEAEFLYWIDSSPKNKASLGVYEMNVCC